jgi:hypothetical protein
MTFLKLRQVQQKHRRTTEKKLMTVAPPQLTIAIGGCQTPNLQHPSTTDELRVAEFNRATNENVRVIGFGSVAGNCVDLSNHTFINWRFSNKQGWEIMVELCVRWFFLDWWWLAASRSWGYTSNGYGKKWFTHIIPKFFDRGGEVVILPNDSQGGLEELLKDSEADVLKIAGYHFMTTQETSEYYMFVSSSESAELDRRWMSESVGVRRAKAGTTATKHHLDLLNRSRPFLVVWNKKVISNVQEVYDQMTGMVEKKNVKRRGNRKK